jgi:glycosyltransferase involved in cell wall biosynthesis
VAWLAAARPGARTLVLPPLVDKGDLASFWRHRRAVARLRADVFHANLRSLWSCQYALLAAATVPGLRLVAIEHSPVASVSGTSRRLKRWTSRRLAAHVAVGTGVARTIEELAGVARGSMVTIHNGVPIPPLPWRDADPSDELTVATVARLDRAKGVDVLVRAVARLERARLLVFGDGEERGALRALGDELGLGDRLVLAGWCDDAMGEAAEHADVFVLPSRLEAFPLTVLEAMAHGIPVVATDVGSTAEAIVDGESGLLVEVDDVAGLEAALRKMQDPAYRHACATAARARVEERFSVATMARAYESLYDDVTSRGRPAGR